MSIAPVTVASVDREDGDEDQLEQPERPDARDLAGHQLTGADRREEHLDDARGSSPRSRPWPPRRRSRRAARRATSTATKRDRRLRVPVGIGRQDRRGVDRMLVLERLDGRVGRRPHPRARRRSGARSPRPGRPGRAGPARPGGRGGSRSRRRTSSMAADRATASTRPSRSAASASARSSSKRDDRDLDARPVARSRRRDRRPRGPPRPELERVGTARVRAEQDEDREDGDA